MPFFPSLSFSFLSFSFLTFCFLKFWSGVGNVLKSWKLFQAWIFFFAWLLPHSNSWVDSGQHVSSVLNSSNKSIWKLTFVFNLSSVKALHCSLMRLINRLRPHPPLLEEKRRKSCFLVSCCFIWLLALWRRRWQQSWVSGSETWLREEVEHAEQGLWCVILCVDNWHSCAAALILLFNGARRSSQPQQVFMLFFPLRWGEIQVSCLLYLGLVLRRWKCPGA